MHTVHPVIQLAKERALFRFSALSSLMLQDAHASLGQQHFTSASEQKTLSASRDFLVAFGPRFLERLHTSYSGYLERGMQTMYRDLRQGMHEISADTLTLVDDDTVMRQIEVERRVLRLREADQQSLGRLNLMIAQLHGEHDVRERENPFRPYLMARALHDALCEMTQSPDVCTMLFDHLSGALATQLPSYFTAIRDVFESSGVHARLLARPSALSRRDREMLTEARLSEFRDSMMPSMVSPALERILTLLQQNPQQSSAGMNNGAAAPRILAAEEPNVQDFVWKIFNQSVAGRAPAAPRRVENLAGRHPTPVAKRPLLDHLSSLQKQAAVDGDAQPQVDLSSAPELAQAGELDRVALDVASMLFDRIACDALIPNAFRPCILQLRLPFAKAVILSPDILQQADHPARRLLDRMASVATGQSAETDGGKAILAEMERAGKRILESFGDDTAIFTDVLKDFDDTVAQLLGHQDEAIARTVAVLDVALQGPGRCEVLSTRVADVLRMRLLTLQADQRAVDFLCKTWSNVLGQAIADNDATLPGLRDVVPDLLWSVQKLDANERSRLMRLLPTLVQRVRNGLKLIDLPADDAQRAMDDLVAMHTEVLRTMQPAGETTATSLVELHRHFAEWRIDETDDAQALHAPTVSLPQLQAALKKADTQLELHLDSDIGLLSRADADWLAGMQVGTAIERWNGTAYQSAVLVWVDARLSFYLFKTTRSAEVQSPQDLLLYSSIALIRALREGSVGMVESAPVFDRAISALLQNGNGETPTLH